MVLGVLGKVPAFAVASRLSKSPMVSPVSSGLLTFRRLITRRTRLLFLGLMVLLARRLQTDWLCAAILSGNSACIGGVVSLKSSKLMCRVTKVMSCISSE
jgi:hypothetical protein